MLKLSENPPVLSPEHESVSAIGGRWWVAHTKARFEKSFAWDLLREGIAYFLPMVERVRVSGGRKRRMLMPLFPSYVFLCGDEEDRYTAMTTHRLCQTLEVPDQPGLVADLASLEKALAGKAELDPYPHTAVGQRCRVSAGPFRGLEGVVIHRNRVAKVVLEVRMLGQGAVMEIEADLLEAVA
ncbi:MAG TPA: transcription termination/antitermination NusG family protein [Phycisphaerae bacterium]|nr:transcription termination/antitermination NusG family protein [Phycisphaerae bacterium]